jgi:hypothetical protein
MTFHSPLPHLLKKKKKKKKKKKQRKPYDVVTSWNSHPMYLVLQKKRKSFNISVKCRLEEVFRFKGFVSESIINDIGSIG